MAAAGKPGRASTRTYASARKPTRHSHHRRTTPSDMSLSYMAPNRYTPAMVIPALALSDRRGRGGEAISDATYRQLRQVPATIRPVAGAPHPPAHPAGMHRAASLVATVRRRSAYY